MYGGKGSDNELELERRRIKVLKVLLLQKYGKVLTYVVENLKLHIRKEAY